MFLSRRLLATIFAALFVMPCWGQSTKAKQTARPTLAPLTEVLRLPWVAGTSLSGLLPVVPANRTIVGDLATWVMAKKGPSDAGPGEYLRRWYNEAGEVLQDVNILQLQSQDLAGFAYLPTRIPLTVADKNGGPVLLVTSLRGKYEYNTVRFREQEISARVVQSVLVPVQKAIAKHLREKSDLQYYGAVITYAVRNFAAEETSSYRTLSMISPAKSVIDYSDLSITDGQLLRSSDFYVLAEGDLRKIEVSVP